MKAEASARRPHTPYFSHLPNSPLAQRFFTRYNIDVADHPLYLPDLNPTEHAWVLLKCQVTEDYPDLCIYPGGVDTVKARLAEGLPLCREKIPEMQFETLWKSMPDRVQAVIEVKG